MLIRVIENRELEFAHNLTKNEGWDTFKNELKILFLCSPKGFFIAEKRNKPIGIVSTINYGNFGFIGNLIVVKTSRGEGVGTDLMNHAINYLKSKGLKNIMIDAVPEIAPLYEKLGFTPVCRSLRLEGEVYSHKMSKLVHIMTKDNIHKVLKLDREHFKGDRKCLLKEHYKAYPNYCYVLERSKDIKGFIMFHPKKDYLSVGPWIVDKDELNPQILLQSLNFKNNYIKMRIGVLESNQISTKILYSLQFIEYSYSIRMVLGEFFSQPDSVFCIAGPDRG